MRSTTSAVAAIKLQARDLNILRGLFESRVMTAAHITFLYFNGRREAAKKRLQRLKSANLIAERLRKTFEPAVLFLTDKGLASLDTLGILRDYPTFDVSVLRRRAHVAQFTLAHELEVIDVKVALCAAIGKTDGASVAEFTTWPFLNQFQVRGETVRPDGFIRIHTARANRGRLENSFFLEVDRSTERQEILAARASYYLDHYKSGGFAESGGSPRESFRDYPFRLLYVLKTAERRNNTIERLLQQHPPILAHVWLTTLPEFQSDPLSAIWIRPVDYRDATAGTPFAPAHRRSMHSYRRRTARELFVDTNVPRLSLL